jgi:DNA-binding transcriptional MocR family regulator
MRVRAVGAILLQYSITSVSLQFHRPGARGIIDAIETAIRSASLPPGSGIPSVRDLAASAGVSPATASAALADLRRRGLVVTRERRRSFVSPRPPLSLAATHPALPPGARDLASGHPDIALLPDLGRAVARIEVRQRSYDEDPILPELADLARGDFVEAGVDARQVTLASGALDGVERVLAAHLRPGDRVAVEDPCYSSLLDLVRAIGLTPVPVAIDDRGLQPTALDAVLRSGVDGLVLTPRAQNPTGAALDRRRRDQLSRVLDRYRDTLVVEDDHQGPVAGAAGLSVVRRQARWAYVRSVTKALGPDLRLAFVTGDDVTVSRVEGRLAVGPGWVSEILQRTVVRLLTARSTATALARATRLYAERREALVAALAERAVAATGRSGFNVWVPVADEAHTVAALLQRGWAVAPGARFRLESPPAVRVTTATLAPPEADRLAADIASALAPGRPRRAA